MGASTALPRRTFLATPLLASRGTGLRTIAYNIRTGLGFPETAENRSRYHRLGSQQLQRISQELLLYEPDVVTLSESTTLADAKKLSKLMGMQLVHFPSGQPSFPGYPAGLPGSVLTRLRILETENAPGRTSNELFSRHFGRVMLADGDLRLAVYSCHLHPRDTAIRTREIELILRLIQQDLRQGRSVLLQGDLNHQPDVPEYAMVRSAGLTDTFQAQGKGSGLTHSSVEPTLRIDYIWAGGPIAGRLQEARSLFEGAFRTNPSDSSSVALSDHLPVEAVFA